MTAQEICSESSQVEMSEHDSSQPEMSQSGLISDLSTPLYSAWPGIASAVRIMRTADRLRAGFAGAPQMPI